MKPMSISECAKQGISRQCSNSLPAMDKPGFGEGYGERQKALITAQFQNLFSQLCAIFPGFRAAVRSQVEFNEIRQQWVLALLESNICRRNQIEAGLRVARQQNSDFLPSPGKFIAWCKEGGLSLAELPTVDEAMAEFKRYGAEKGFYPTAEMFPWRLDVMYQIIPETRRRMHQYNLTNSEVRISLEKQLKHWAKVLSNGGKIPPNRARVTEQTRSLSIAEQVDVQGYYRQKGEELRNGIRRRIQDNSEKNGGSYA